MSTTTLPSIDRRTVSAVVQILPRLVAGARRHAKRYRKVESIMKIPQDPQDPWSWDEYVVLWSDGTMSVYGSFALWFAFLSVLKPYGQVLGAYHGHVDIDERAAAHTLVMLASEKCRTSGLTFHGSTTQVQRTDAIRIMEYLCAGETPPDHE